MVQRRKRNNKWLWGIVFLVLLIVCIIGLVIWNNDSNKDNDKEKEEVDVVKTEEEKNTEDDFKQADEDIDEKKVTQYEGDNPNTANELSGAITYAGVQNGTLMIRVNIDQYLDSGSCELNLKNNNVDVYSSTARIVGGASTATCEGFDVPTNVLTGGLFEIVITLNADNKTGLIKGEVNI